MRRTLLLMLFYLACAGVPPVAADGPPPAPVDADFRSFSAAEVELGRLLYFDPILSGNRNISCATCHHPRFHTADGLSLPVGEGGRGLGPRRDVGEEPALIEARVARNSPALFNLAAREFTVMFHDGRLERDPARPSGFRNPIGPDLPDGFDGVLSMQAMFPVTSGDEMAGHYNENPVAKAARRGDMTGPDGVWTLLARRLAAIPEYSDRFQATYDDVGGPEDITFVHAANAIAAFMAVSFRADETPFDRYRRGDDGALDPAARRGMALFYGKGGCAGCHAGPFQTDHGFHAIAMPQIGPGKKARFESHNRDVGRMRVTGRNEDAYRFRTPSLRNVALTAPYGHSGAYATLEAVVRHHLDPVRALETYDATQAILPPHPGLADADDAVLNNPSEIAAIAAANELAPNPLNDAEVAELIAFLHALTDPRSIDMGALVPAAVPSGLPVDR